MNTADALLGAADVALRTLSGGARAGRPLPQAPEAELSRSQQRLSGALMRVNHVGEVCAQALYQAQALTARDPRIASEMARAAREEIDHLAWTEQRLKELNDRTSLLNPLWYAGAFVIGLAAGRAGDAVSLGFLAETERQVEQHLASHLDRLPPQDERSRAIVAQMKRDESEHAAHAEASGAVALPGLVTALMRAASKLMTVTAHRI